MLETAVDRLGRAVARAGLVEVREDVSGSLLQRAAEPAELDQSGRDAAGDSIDHALHGLPPGGAIRVAVGGDHALVDPPGRLDLDMLLRGEQCLQAGLLPVNEEPRPGMESAAGRVERVALPSAPAEHVALNTAAAVIEAVPARRTTWNGSITAVAVGISSAAADLKPVNPSIATTSTPSRQLLGRAASQVFNTCFERPSTMSSSREGPPVPVRIGVRSMITVT